MRALNTRRSLSLVLALLAVPSVAAAQEERFAELELSLPLSLGSRSATGTPDELLGYGYDDETGLLAGLDARLYYVMNRYFALGPGIAGSHQAGPLLGAVEGHAFRTTFMDAGLAARVLFPCMSEDDRRVYLSGLLAVSGVHADAGLGRGGQENGELSGERAAASRSLDHAGLGWRLALDLSVHLGNFLVGGGLGIRQYFGIDSPVARGWTMDLGLRIGGRIDLPSEPVRPWQHG